MTEHKHLRRLARIWALEPVFFITTCTRQRKTILANNQIARILVDEWSGAVEKHGWMVGRYVIMPEHVHFFCAPVGGIIEGGSGAGGIIDPTFKNLSVFMQQWTSKRILRECSPDLRSPDGPSGPQQRIEAPIWQVEFFDHLLRSQENYRQKWEYVRENPVRKGLVQHADDWPWQGEIHDLRV